MSIEQEIEFLKEKAGYGAMGREDKAQMQQTFDELRRRLK